PEREQVLRNEILDRYQEESLSFYHPEDLNRGSICGVDRKGRPFQFLVTLSIGIVNDSYCHTHTNSVDKISLTRRVGFLTAEVKRQAKLSSNHISDVRPLQHRHYQYLVQEPSHPVCLYDRFHTFWSSQSCSPGTPVSYSQKP